MAADLNIVVNGTPVPVYLGENTALSLAAKNSAAASAAAAALSEATAESAAGPTYPDTAAGLAATADGQAFAVDNGDGTVTIYLNDRSEEHTSELQSLMRNSNAVFCFKKTNDR